MVLSTDLLELPSVTHRGDHLGEFVLVTLENSVDKLPVRFPAEIVPGGYPEISSSS